jgi:hypothetical protein
MSDESIDLKVAKSQPQRDKESYVRWQQYAITQLGYAINFLFTVAAAIIGFASKEIIEQRRYLSHDWWPVLFFKCCFPFLAFSTILALGANITRAFDFRYTRHAALDRWKGEEKDAERCEKRAEDYGKWTWGLFIAQIACFIVGIAFLSLSIFFGLVPLV